MHTTPTRGNVTGRRGPAAANSPPSTGVSPVDLVTRARARQGSLLHQCPQKGARRWRGDRRGGGAGAAPALAAPTQRAQRVDVSGPHSQRPGRVRACGSCRPARERYGARRPLLPHTGRPQAIAGGPARHPAPGSSHWREANVPAPPLPDLPTTPGPALLHLLLLRYAVGYVNACVPSFNAPPATSLDVPYDGAGRGAG